MIFEKEYGVVSDSVWYRTKKKLINSGLLLNKGNVISFAIFKKMFPNHFLSRKVFDMADKILAIIKKDAIESEGKNLIHCSYLIKIIKSQKPVDTRMVAYLFNKAGLSFDKNGYYNLDDAAKLIFALLITRSWSEERRLNEKRKLRSKLKNYKPRKSVSRK